MIHQELSKVLHLATVQQAIREYKAAYAAQGAKLKAAELRLNSAVEKALSPK